MSDPRGVRGEATDGGDAVPPGGGNGPRGRGPSQETDGHGGCHGRRGRGPSLVDGCQPKWAMPNAVLNQAELAEWLGLSGSKEAIALKRRGQIRGRRIGPRRYLFVVSQVLEDLRRG